MLNIIPLKNTELKEFRSQPLVMLIDDNEINNYINSKILRRYEFSDRILIYQDSTMALEYLQKAWFNGDDLPGVIFLDLNIPIMDGQMFVDRFALLPADVKDYCNIVILTNSSNPNDKSKMLSNKNILNYFNPPLIKNNLDQLLACLKKTDSIFFPKAKSA